VAASANTSWTLARFSVPILEEGGRLGLKYLLLSYFRVADNSGTIASRVHHKTLAFHFFTPYETESVRWWVCDDSRIDRRLG
jgi:hypothetical protein